MAEKDKTQLIKELMTKLAQIRNIGIVAHIDHGKCVSSDAKISLTNGENVPAEELFNRLNKAGTIVKNGKEGVVIKLKKPAFVNSFDVSKCKVQSGRITHIWKLKKTEPLIEVTVETGRKIKTTPEHKFLILKKTGVIVEKKASDLKEQDVLVTARKLIHKGMKEDETKQMFLMELSKDVCFYVKLKRGLKRKLHESILNAGVKNVHKKINSVLKSKSFYHGVWRGEYRLCDLVRICKIFKVKLSDVWNQIEYINYRKVERRGAHSSIPIKLDRLEDIYYLAGLFFGDGDLNGNITNNSLEIQKKLKKIAARMGMNCIIRKWKNRATRIEIGGITFRKILEIIFNYPLSKKSSSLRISHFLEKSKKKYISAFLRGYFDADGCVEKGRSAVSISSKSEKLLLDLQLLLYKFDISSKLNYKKLTLYISGKKSLLNFRKIGFTVQHKQRSFEMLLKNSTVSKWDYVYISGNVLKTLREKHGLSQLSFFNGYCNYENNRVGLSKESLRRILSHYPEHEVGDLLKLTNYDVSFVRIKNLKKIRRERWVYDFTVEKQHNFIADGFIIHNTTLTDNLLAGAGMISEELAGKQLAMDFDAQEQERGITIYAANVSMTHTYEGQNYLINLIDTPGHVDFGGDVTRAMRAVDGAVVVIDAVEGVMPQTETVLRQALKERVKPVLFVNKTDRLIKELKLTPEQMLERFKNIIKEVNLLIKKYVEPEYKDKWYVSVDEGTVAFGSALKNWAVSVPFMRKTGVTFKDVIELTEKGEEKELAKKAPLHEVLLDMVVKHLPNPLEAQKYRISKIWPGEIDSEIGKSMVNCDKDGPLAAIVTKIYPDPHAGFVATVRIFSGSIKKGQDVYLSGVEKTEKVQQVSLYKGQKRINMEVVSAGNIVGVVGLKEAFSGCTLSNPDYKIPPFEEIKHIFEPVVTKAIEPKNPKDLAKLIEFLKKIGREDPTLRVTINEDTGEYLVSGLGELHIEAKVERKLKDEGIDVSVSPPIVIYHESVKSTTPEAIEGKSPNKHNRFYIVVEPVDQPVYEAMVKGEITDQELKRKNIELQNKLIELGFDREEAKRVKLIYNKCMLLDMTHGVHAILEVIEMIKQAFIEAMDNGPLAREPCSAVKVKLVDAKLHEDAIHRGPAQVIPAVRGAIREAMLKSGAYIKEPKQIIRIDVPTEQLGGATKEINNRRGQIIDMKEERGMTIITAKIPVAEMFGFNSALKSATGGLGFYSLIDIVYEPLPKELEQKVISQIKERKGIKDVE